MIAQLRPALVTFLFLTLITGVAYPLAMTGIGQAVFPDQSNGSILQKNGAAVGSALIGQPFDDPKYFFGRPSATSPVGYNGGASSGSNLGPTNPALIQAVKDRVEALKKLDPSNDAPVPIDLVTASASGLDPHITPAAAYYQVARIARVRKIDPEELRALVTSHLERRTLGLVGEPRVNVLRLNLALDDLK